MKRKCICDICNCGRHRCTHQPTGLYEKSNQLCLLTEYNEKYPEYGRFCPPSSMKPKQDYQADRGKMDGTTTFKADYIPYEVSRRPGRLQEEYKPSSGHIDLGTTYKMDYNPYKVQALALARPRERTHVTGGKLDTLPTYKDDFRPWEITKREPAKPDLSYHPSSSKFANSTTFQDDFAPKSLVPRESFKPPNMTRLSDAPFDGLTSNRISYIAHPLESKFVKPKEEYKPSSQAFEDLTIHKRDFKGLPGEISKSCKPDFSRVVTDARFNSSTEFRDRFQQWPVSLPQVHKAAEYVSPDGHMDLSTTSHCDYVKHKIQPFVPIRPISRGRRSAAPFQGSTTMKEDFKTWEVRKQEMIKKQEEMTKPSGKFDSLTTFKAHFTPHDIHPSMSCKPLNVALRSSAPFDDGTMYRTEFTPKRAHVCPASFDSPPGYVFEEADHRGHRYFRMLSSPAGNSIALADKMQAPKEVAVVS
ncbi:stabilizer of axonemal microtubules 2 [Lepisosteus oculatus]|nr:PREDICTED: stabilizer of axonemal microtubules 2 [Lepisosteus oculatus]